MSDPFVGQIMAVPYTFAPLYWAFCQGQQTTIQQQQALYSLMGTIFGGNGTTYFNLPDLQGRVAIGAGNATSLGLGNLAPGTKGGNASQTLNANQVPLVPHAHNASFTGTGGGGGGGAATASGSVSLSLSSGTFSSSVTVTGNVEGNTGSATATTPQDGWLPGDTGGTPIYVNPTGISAGSPVNMQALSLTGTVSGPLSGNATGNVSLPVTGGGGGITGGTVTVAPAGQAASAAVSTMPPYLVINTIIALNGLYPQRP